MERFDCDARCTNAKGLTCTCWCGGVNHGRDAFPPTAVRIAESTQRDYNEEEAERLAFAEAHGVNT